jgi:DNA polymerase III alpha subunit
MWDGPSVDGVKGWYKDKAISDLIELLSSRRVPVEEGEAAIQKFAEAQPEDKRDAQLTLLFAGLFDKINSQRRGVLSGIEKYQKSQKERAKELERQSTEIARLEGEAGSNESVALDQAREHYNWAQRIFQERQSSIPLACELPVLMEERLYAFTRSIRGLMKS